MSDKNISLVERDKLKLVSDEMAITKMFGSGIERAKAGKILGADFLVLIGADEKNLGGNMIVLVITT